MAKKVGLRKGGEVKKEMSYDKIRKEVIRFVEMFTTPIIDDSGLHRINASHKMKFHITETKGILREYAKVSDCFYSHGVEVIPYTLEALKEMNTFNIHSPSRSFS